MREIVTLVVAPLFVGLVLALVSYWLGKKDND
ncbi:type I toxin-antitoxin system Fst family toxin [Candidatus Enterococcus huntleyi]|nr:type I toxin-antitoxin system Fst family toxin [Enterococcus sp. JM4C]